MKLSPFISATTETAVLVTNLYPLVTGRGRRERNHHQGDDKMQILRMTCSTDWKGRPHTRIVLIGLSHDQGSIARIIESDVQQWQADDLKNDLEVESEIAEEDGTELVVPTVWENDTRWEMVREEGEEVSPEDWVRAFVECVEGNTTTIAYHLLPE